MKAPALFQGKIITKKQKRIDEISKSSSLEPLFQFQQIFNKASLGEGDSSLFKLKAIPFSLGTQPFNFHKVDNGFIFLLINIIIIICLLI